MADGPASGIGVVFVLVGDGGKTDVFPTALREQPSGEVIFVIAMKHHDHVGLVVKTNFGELVPPAPHAFVDGVASGVVGARVGVVYYQDVRAFSGEAGLESDGGEGFLTI